MRILSASFGSKNDFLTHVRDVEKGGAIFCRTDVDLRIGEPVLVEIDFPGLPNRALVRGAVSGFDALGAGAWVEFAEEDTSTRDFAMALAQGEVEVNGKVSRRHKRFPVHVPVDWEVPGEDAHYVSSTEDLGAGGIFIRTLSPPPVGTVVALRLGPGGSGDLLVQGTVAWVRTDGDDIGMGICFAESERGVHVLKEILDQVSDRGRFSFLLPRGQT